MAYLGNYPGQTQTKFAGPGRQPAYFLCSSNRKLAKKQRKTG